VIALTFQAPVCDLIKGDNLVMLFIFKFLFVTLQTQSSGCS